MTMATGLARVRFRGMGLFQVHRVRRPGECCSMFGIGFTLTSLVNGIFEGFLFAFRAEGIIVVECSKLFGDALAASLM